MKHPKKKFPLSLPELGTFSTYLASLMTRDNAEFTARGVTAADKTAFEALITAFKNLPSDDEYKGLITIEVAAKNTLKKSIIAKVQNISGYVEQAFGHDSGQYKRLAIQDFQKLSDDDMVYRGREVVRIATEYATTLTPLGCTQAKIEALTSDITAFEAKLTTVEAAKNNRQINTDNRSIKGNELYLVVVKYCKIGKLIWENVNPAKYNDYIIRPKTPILPGKVLNLTYKIEEKLFIWEMAENAEKYELQYKTKDPYGPVPKFTTIYNDVKNEVSFPLEGGEYVARCRGENGEGYGAWSDEYEFAL